MVDSQFSAIRVLEPPFAASTGSVWAGTILFMQKSLRLSSEELRDLIGTSRRSQQIQWLKRRGWRFDVDVNGRPVVLHAFVDSRLGVADRAEVVGTVQHNFAALER